MIDIHSHFLFNVDDGPEDIEVSREILEIYRDAGFTTVVETTHCYPGLYEIDKNVIQEKIEQLRVEAIKLFYTREYFVDFIFIEKLEEGKIIPYPDGEHILIEFSFSIPPLNWEQIIFHIQTRGFTPILAHPERYDWLNSVPQFINEFIQRGGLLQGNIGSFAGHYGRYVRKKFTSLLEEDKYHFLATDTHSPQQLKEVIETIPKLQKLIGETKIRYLLEENPARIVEGQK